MCHVESLSSCAVPLVRIGSSTSRLGPSFGLCCAARGSEWYHTQHIGLDDTSPCGRHCSIPDMFSEACRYSRARMLLKSRIMWRKAASAEVLSITKYEHGGRD